MCTARIQTGMEITATASFRDRAERTLYIFKRGFIEVFIAFFVILNIQQYS